MTRNRKDRTSHYPDLEQAAHRAIGADLIADGEIVAFDGPRTSFSRLQGRMQNARPSAALVAQQPVIYYLFDLLWLDGRDLRSLPLSDRKDRLREAIAFADPIRYSDHLEEDGELGLRAACEQGLEGLIAKRAASTYVAGRSREWLKLKCVLEQEFVVLGWTDPQRSRHGIGALLVGYFQDGDLRYAGKVGTGFNQRELDRLAGMLTKRERAEPPLQDTTGVQKRGVHWAKPDLVAQVGFGEWTPDGKLRHPRYLGLRDDKAATEVVRER
jgi:DNA ligase D-like protein (predicted ligase)